MVDLGQLIANVAGIPMTHQRSNPTVRAVLPDDEARSRVAEIMAERLPDSGPQLPGVDDGELPSEGASVVTAESDGERAHAAFMNVLHANIDSENSNIIGMDRGDPRSRVVESPHIRNMRKFTQVLPGF